MSCRVKEHQHHTKQSIFHHGLIKLIINTVLQSRGKTWEYFIFCSGFQNDQEGQSHRRQADKGQTFIRKLRQKVKVKDEDRIKSKEVSDHANENFEFKQQLNDNESKNLQSDIKEAEFVENVVHVETNSDKEEDIEVQRQIPITVLSEDEKFLFDDDKVPFTDATRVCIEKEFHSQGDEVALPKRKKIKVVEFASVTHQGKTFKMLGEIAPIWRPKTRPKNKLRLNMKKFLNPKLNKERVIVIDDSSSDEKLNEDKGDSKGKGPME